MILQNSMPLQRSEYVALTVSTNDTKKAFAPNFTLSGKKIRSIDCHQVANVSYSPDGNALISADLFKRAFLVLSVKGEEKINRIPLSALDPVLNDGKRIHLDGLEIDFTKSYVMFASAVAAGDNGNDILFNFYFND